MKSRNQGTVGKAIWIMLAAIGGVVWFWLFPLKLFLPETIRLVEAAGFRFEQRYGNLCVYTANFRKGTSA